MYSIARPLISEGEFIQNFLKRLIFRIYPIRVSQACPDRQIELHYQTMGVRDSDILRKKKNLIIFDDIIKTKTQLIAIANILRSLYKFSGNLYAIVLGQAENFSS